VIAQLDRFYADELGLRRRGDCNFQVGESELRFSVGVGEPFYHFALLVPGDRFDGALEWAGARVDLLRGGDIEEVVFDFENWNALAFYFHDPAGNIVELIAHRGLAENRRGGSFESTELVGLSEIGLVGDPRTIAEGLDRLKLHMWDGELGQHRLAFFGERGRTLIVAPKGRGWLPTRRPAGGFPVEVVTTGPLEGEVLVVGHRIRRERAKM
jgi:hypothetical protein